MRRQVPLLDGKGTNFFTIDKARTYDKLESLPCLLVLCEKGRMGDTFPCSFACLDLRVRSADSLSTIIQELGRLCRYPAAEPEEAAPPEAEYPRLFEDGKAVKWQGMPLGGSVVSVGWASQS